MARSLTVSHEEDMSVNWLFAGFLLIAVGWMTLAGIASATAAQTDVETAGLASAGDAVLQPISRK